MINGSGETEFIERGREICDGEPGSGLCMQACSDSSTVWSSPEQHEDPV